MNARLSLLAALLAVAPATVHAGASDWHEMTGGKLRFVTERSADDGGNLRAALEIRLDDGWKTYWREPGETGVAPQVAIANTSAADGVDVLFPAPERFDDGTSQWAGYDGNVMLPVIVTGLADAAAPLALDVFLGVCETICVPVQATLAATPGEDIGPIGEAAISTAFASLPGKPSEGLAVVRASHENDRIVIEVALPPGQGEADLFLAGRDGLLLAAPEFTSASGGGTFTARIVAPPKDGAVGADYTLVAGDAAVAGTLPLP